MTPQEATCTWPDGQRREVMIISTDGEKSRIIWNEHVDSPEKAVTGMEETVPAGWLTLPFLPPLGPRG